MKCGIALVKEQKIQQLEKTNYDLEKQLTALLQEYQSYTSEAQSHATAIKNISLQISVQEARNQMMKMSIAAKQKQLQRVLKDQQQTDACLQATLSENKMMNSELYELNCTLSAIEDTNRRLKKEIATYKVIGDSNTNLVRTTDKIKKANQCLVRKLAIFENKLQSHYRYLDVLQNKAAKEEKEAQQKQLKEKKQSKTHISNKAVSSKFHEKVQEEQMKKMDGKSRKQFNDLVRKKNQILMKGK